MKQVDATRKQRLLQSTVATLLRKRKQIEDAASPNAINPQRKELKVTINKSTGAAILKWLQGIRATNLK